MTHTLSQKLVADIYVFIDLVHAKGKSASTYEASALIRALDSGSPTLDRCVTSLVKSAFPTGAVKCPLTAVEKAFVNRLVLRLGREVQAAKAPKETYSHSYLLTAGDKESLAVITSCTGETLSAALQRLIKAEAVVYAQGSSVLTDIAQANIDDYDKYNNYDYLTRHASDHYPDNNADVSSSRMSGSKSRSKGLVVDRSLSSYGRCCDF